MYGKHHSEASKQKNRESHIGKVPGNKGKHHSEAAKKKMREKKLGKKNGRSDEKHPLWKGNNVGYAALHEWIDNHKPKVELCEDCKNKKKLELANISGEYKRDINDFKWLCSKCHKAFDKKKRGIE
jgi:hypothetical protein